MPQNVPITVKRSIELLGLMALVALLVYAQDIIMPLMMAFFISLMLMPMFRWFKNRGIPEALSVFLCIVTFIIIIASIVFLLSWQISTFFKDMSSIQENLSTHWKNITDWIESKTHYSYSQQLEVLRTQGAKLGENVSKYLQTAFTSLSGILLFVGLIPIYLFLIIFYRNLLVRFVFMWFNETDHPKVETTVRETEVMVKYYLLGLLIQISYLTILLSLIMYFFGIKHALLIGITFAILNLIPYLGALVGNLIAVILTLTSSQELWQVWAVLGTIAFVQFLDNNILMPRIVGSKVKVNALASIVGIIIGGQIAGVSGMFLSIPVMALLKIIFDKSEGFQKWGVILGEARPRLSPMSYRMFRVNRRATVENDNKSSAPKNKNKSNQNSDV